MADDRFRDRDDNSDDKSDDSADSNSSNSDQPGNQGQQPGGSGDQPTNPFEALFGAFSGQPGQGGGPDFATLMQQFQQALSQMGMGGFMAMPMAGMPGMPGMNMPGAGPGGQGAVGSEQIRDMARRVVAGLGPDPSPTSKDTAAIADAVRLADTWLDEATSFSGMGAQAAAWSRAEWVEKSMPGWGRIIEPVVKSMSEAMANTVAPEGGEQSALGGLEAMLRPWLKSSGSTIFGLQAGEAIGRLAGSVLSGTETGLPLEGEPVIALVPANVAKFGEGLEESANDVRLYLTLREVARQRLFHRAPWLGPQILNLVSQYASGITIDTSAIENAITGLDLNSLNPQSLEEMSQTLQGSLFEPKQTPQQKETLAKLETLLALTEGWVDDVVAQATHKWMPNAVSLSETLRRRRATEGPAEATFAALVGLELRPRRLRDAANLWAAIRESKGVEERDALWRHPDMLPTSAALDDPIGYVSGDTGSGDDVAASDLDAELAKLLDEADHDDQDPPDDKPE